MTATEIPAGEQIPLDVNPNTADKAEKGNPRPNPKTPIPGWIPMKPQLRVAT